MEKFLLWFWRGWIVAGIVVEGVGLYYGYPLTTYIKERVLTNPFGWLVLGMFLVWLPVHWFLLEKASTVDLLLWIAAGVLMIWAVAGGYLPEPG